MINLNGTTPAAPANTVNGSWQVDGSGNVSVNVPASAQKVATVDLTAQAANIAATTAYTPASSGLVRIVAYIVVTQAATTSSTLPSVVITWTDRDNSTLQTFTLTAASPSGNTLTTYGQAVLVTSALAASNVQYATSSYASSGATPMQYAIHLKVEQL